MVTNLFQKTGILSLFLLFFSPIFSNPLENYPLEEYGIASWYSDNLNGTKTANGERYDKNIMTAAHKSLPFGTLVRVVRLDNQRSVTVRINDRGPFTKGFIIDLSRVAADRLDLLEIGIAQVKIEVIGSTNSKEPLPDILGYDPSVRPTVAPPTPKPLLVSRPDLKPLPAEKPVKLPAKPAKPAQKEKNDPAFAVFEKVTAQNFKSFDLYKIEITRPKKAGYGVQVSVLTNAENVFQTVAKIQSNFDNVLMSVEPGKGNQSIYKIIVGPYADKDSAEKAAKKLRKLGHKESFSISLNE
jgi:rare lipoprotein A